MPHARPNQARPQGGLLETRQVKAALSAMVVKTDRKDARGIAQLLRMGWYTPAHSKQAPARQVGPRPAGRALLPGKSRMAG